MSSNNLVMKYFQIKQHFGKLDQHIVEPDLSLKPRLCKEMLLKKQFEIMQPQAIFDCKTQASKAFKNTMKNKSSVMEMITLNNTFIISLLDNGRCSIYSKESKRVVFFNKSQDEQIRSIFHNRVNDSIIVVSVTKKDEYNSLKCRTVPIKTINAAFQKTDVREDHLLLNGEFKGQKLFKDFSLRWPDFIEFDEINSKIITKHSIEDAYRVWSLSTYQLQYVLKNDQIAEFKICNGVMLLLHQLQNGIIPMSLINIHNGNEIQKFQFEKIQNEIEFLEQFNEKIMIKGKDKNLKIYNAWTNTIKEIEGFEAPEAFIFLYEKEKFLTLKDGKIEIWTSDGELLTNFNDQILSTKMDMPGDLSNSTSNYIDIQNEQVIARLKIQTKKANLYASSNAIQRRRRLSNNRKISSLYYDESTHELFLGYSDGELECWSASSSHLTSQLNFPLSSVAFAQESISDNLQQNNDLDNNEDLQQFNQQYQFQ